MQTKSALAGMRFLRLSNPPIYFRGEYFSLGAKKGEKDRLADAGAGEQHDQPVHADPDPARGWHAVLHGLEERLVEVHRLGVATGREQRLLLEPPALDHRVVELGVRRSELDPVDDQVPRLVQSGRR